jgi:hypothetical protein
VFSLLSIPLEMSVATITEIQQQVHSLESLLPLWANNVRCGPTFFPIVKFVSTRPLHANGVCEDYM